MPLFGKSSKNPVEVVKSLREAVNALEKVDKKAEKVCQDSDRQGSPSDTLLAAQWGHPAWVGGTVQRRRMRLRQGRTSSGDPQSPQGCLSRFPFPVASPDRPPGS